jgi:hypothetical protein
MAVWRLGKARVGELFGEKYWLKSACRETGHSDAHTIPVHYRGSGLCGTPSSVSHIGQQRAPRAKSPLEDKGQCDRDLYGLGPKENRDHRV